MGVVPFASSPVDCQLRFFATLVASTSVPSL
jgi:hypothetical protein